MESTQRLVLVMCGGFLCFVLTGANLAVAQVPDVGPGKCVVESGTCGDYSPNYGNSSSSGSGGSSYSGPTARQRAALRHQQIMNNMMLNTMQGLMSNFMAGIQRGIEQNRQREQQRQQQLMRRAREEMARERQRALNAQRAMERNRKQFQAAKERIAGVARTMGATALTARPILRVSEEVGAFGTRVLKPRDTGALVAMDDKAKVACGQGLLFEAGGAAVAGSSGGLVASLKEAAFLSRQANHAVSGGRLDVACPSGHSNSPSLADDEIGLMSETIQQQSEVFSALYERIADNMEGMTDSRNMVEESKEKLAKTQMTHDQTARAVESLQADMPSAQDDGSSPIDPDELAAKQSALAEALAALQESEQTLDDIRNLYDKNLTAMNEMEESMKSVEALMQKVLTDPQGTAELRTELGLPSLPENREPG